ncbi:MAG: transposase [bacterium]
MDQAGWHIAQALKIPDSMRVIELPPYSPLCNPVEHLWEEIREKWFPNREYASLQAVEDARGEGLATLEKDKTRIAHLAGFDWITNIPWNAT